MPSRRELANAIRALAMDAVERAQSGHPGAPMGLADVAEVLWRDFLVHNPENPHWVNRDRFVLSNGHASMLLYALLHLTGYHLSIGDLENFRQLHSHTPGHPEYGETPGVETTTGPLGQGLANAVGMALAEKVLAAQFNRPDTPPVIDHYTYVFAGDGCLMEGISHEACSLAGTLKLGKLIVFYDDNDISIDGHVRGGGDRPAWFTDDTPARFAAYGWHVVPGVDGHDPEAVRRAILAARAERERPSLICVRTVIGFGAPNLQGSEACHGAPLGAEEVRRAREFLGWPYDPFEIPEEIYEAWDAREKGARAEREWLERFELYRSRYPSEAVELERRLVGQLPGDFAELARQWILERQAQGGDVATRKASKETLDALAPHLPELFGGSADLTHSNLTFWRGARAVTPADASGNYLHYGVREFAMAAIANGMALHGGFIPFGATFLVFMEYCRNAVRLAALMRAPAIFVFTHDSIGLGEDGPTHQPVEQLTNLRTTPGLVTWRPCDAVETAAAWKAALERREGPTALVLSRQTLPHQERTAEQVAAIERGGYVLWEAGEAPQAILLATGSEVSLAMGAARRLAAEGLAVRVVSLPSAEVFESQDPAYREAVLPAAVRARVAVEAAHPDWWRKYVGLDGAVVGLDRFGASAPGKVLLRHFGFTEERVVEAVRAVVERVRGC